MLSNSGQSSETSSKISTDSNDAVVAKANTPTTKKVTLPSVKSHVSTFNSATTKINEEAPQSALKRSKIQTNMSHRQSMARGITNRVAQEVNIVEMVIDEADLALPQCIKNLAAVAFNCFCDPETEMLAVDKKLGLALNTMGHNSTSLAMKDICARFGLDYSLVEPTSISEDEDASTATGKEAEKKKISGKNELDLSEFIAVVYSELVDQAQPQDLAKAFEMFDMNKNNEVDMDEFEAGLMALGDMNPLDESGRAAFLAKIDVDGDETLSSQELRNWVEKDTFDSFIDKIKTSMTAGPPSYFKKNSADIEQI
jgi:Ca2+-binding EF-hand superfamily protein